MLGQEVAPGPSSTLMVGVTGNSGCGQSTVAGMAAGFARGVCSLDETGHRLLRKPWVLRELESQLGRRGLSEMSRMELRRVLGEIVFSDPSSLRKLNSVVHPRMAGWARLAAARLSGRGGIWILEGALIYELGLDGIMDTMIVVRDSFERCAERLGRRDGIPGETIAARWEGQLPMEDKAGRADHLVDNSRDMDYLRRQVISIFAEMEKSLTLD